MRTIKFRAWDIGNQKMYQGEDVCIMFCEGELRKYRIFDKSDKMNFLGNDKHFELMQFTGLHDKNGKEIYEADLIKHPQYPLPLRVEWDYDQWGLFDGICNEASLDKDSEVVSNIFESPELLK